MDSYKYSIQVVGDVNSPGGFGGVWPTEETRITSPFGWRIHPTKGTRKFHNGIDIGTLHRTGVYVLAPISGTVRHTSSRDGGTQISLDSGPYTYSFCHLSQRLVPDGARVNVGDLIALSGNTGASTAPHLHFGIWSKSANGSVAIDPMSKWWIKIKGFEGAPWQK